MKGKLYIVATPIGNLEDITFRAIKTLKEVDFILAEDTRHTIKLLNYYEISKPLISYYRENEKIKSEEMIQKLIDGQKIALVSDAGTPGISDPGEEIVKRAIENNIQVIPIPGACALILALIVSGFNTNEFIFLGFLGANKTKLKEKLEEIKYEKKPIIIYEAPHRIKNTLEIIEKTLGNRKISISRELTKIHEEFLRDDIHNITNNLKDPKGEFVIVIEGALYNKQEIRDTRVKQIRCDRSL